MEKRSNDIAKAATFCVVDDVASLVGAPDIIHGHHHLDAMTALLHFDQTPLHAAGIAAVSAPRTSPLQTGVPPSQGQANIMAHEAAIGATMEASEIDGHCQMGPRDGR